MRITKADDEKRLKEIALELAEISRRRGRSIDIGANEFVSCGDLCYSATVRMFNRRPVRCEQKDVHSVERRVLRAWTMENNETCKGMFDAIARYDIKGE